MKKILISGFKPFDDHKVNSSQIIAERFQNTTIDGLDIRSVILPVTFRESFEQFKVHIDEFKPDFIVSLGLAGSRKAIELEKVAINLIHTKSPDNEGVVWQDTPIIPGGETAYFSTLPIMEMKKVETQFPVEISFSAGAYVCNYLMYKVLDKVSGTDIKAGFIHLPHLKENEEIIFQTLQLLLQKL